MVDPEETCRSCHASLPSTTARCPACGTDVLSQLRTQASPVTESGESIRGRSIGDFRLVRLIGRGGMGSVYEAYQSSMRRKVALKILDGGAMPTGQDVARFEREAWIAGRLAHPNIVKVHAQGVEGLTHYIAMELVEGESLHEVIRKTRASRQGSWRPDSATTKVHIRKMVELFAGLAEGIEHVHAQGIIHRDIKPLNLLLNGDGTRLLLSDFGLARQEDASRMTRRGDFLGTVRYMSPEQLLAHRTRIDHRSDIWSLGVSLYEAITFDFPFEAATEEGYVSAIATKDPAPARARSRAVSKDLETVLMKCLERDPERRYRSAADLKADLDRYLEDKPVLARRPGVLLKTVRFVRRHGAAAGAAALAVIATVVTTGLLLKAMEEKRQRELAEALEISETGRIRWTLKHVKENGAAPTSVQPDWGSLLAKLQDKVRQNPEDPLSLLARRSAVRLTAAMPSFGLTKDPPVVFLGADVVFDPGLPFRYSAKIESSWDEGAWHSFVLIPSSKILTNVVHARLSEIFEGDRLTPGPHKLQLRAILDFPALPDWGGVPASPNYFGSDRAPAGTGKPRHPDPLSETRSLGSFMITLFDSYPSDFPRAVRLDVAKEPPEKWFKVDRVRLLRVKVPSGSTPCFSYEGFSGLTWFGRLPKGQAVLESLAGAVELAGRMDTGIPWPIASDATLRFDVADRPIVQFPITFGACCVAVGNVSRIAAFRPMNTVLEEMSGNLAFSEGLIQGFPQIPADGKVPAHLNLSPSRTVALQARWFDQYLGEAVSIPVQVEIITREAQWESAPQCTGIDEISATWGRGGIEK